jgi:alkanesulfonate monooxygenase SsuD/methylene tetrahydromethanopterin reductase-like flavin-dependent oxidoreductase (luciferase family)
MPSAGIRSGVLVWNQYTDWSGMRAAGEAIDRAGYTSLWTWDHLYPIVGSPHGPFLEGYMVLGGWSQVTSRATLGLMVGANTFRNPGIVVKAVTTLDHLSGGRAVLGIGAAWFEAEHAAFGIDFGASPGERIARLDEAVELMRAMLHAPSATARGDVYHAVDVRNDPRPVQSHLPILIGGAGERKTLRTVARFADMWNVALVTPEEADRKWGVLRRWCDEVGRDAGEIERTVSVGPIVIRDDPADAAAVIARFHERNPEMKRAIITGSPAEVAHGLRGYVERGFRHIIYHTPAPVDLETIERFAAEVVPQLDG